MSNKPSVRLDHYYDLEQGLRARQFATDSDFIIRWRDERISEGCSMKDIKEVIEEITQNLKEAHQ